jgi:hypothetical protein
LVVRIRIRLFRLALLAAVLVALAAVTSADGGLSDCRYGVSSVGPAVINGGQLATSQSDLTPHTEACLD